MPETPDPTVQPDVVVDLKLPPDGTEVSATTIPSIEYDREAEEITGTLYTVPSPFGPPPNCYVDGIGVEPESVRPIRSADRPPSGRPDGQDLRED